ncbi:MAG: ROK family protein [Acidobacteria bacterium]|nr:ROK family protein [Acidobacteriota bacterium]MCH8267646.1 ROK family protein [Acidobacteriota bacterium]
MKRFSVGADLGGTNLRIAAVDESGKIFEKISLATRAQQGRDTVVRELCRAIRELTQKQEGAGSFAGIGVGIPGIIYLKTGTVRQSPNLPGWENYPVRDEIESLLGVRVFLENDANVAALGEKWIGLGRDVNSLCMLTLGTGVGGGVVLDGKIWHGFLGMAGELGHIVVAENGVACSCGGHGCLETEASATAIVRKGEEAVAAGRSPALAEARSKAAKLTARMIYETAKAGDAASKAIFESVGRYLGIGIAGLTNALNLPLYVIGGGAAASWDLFAPAMMEEARKRSFIFREGSTRIERAVLKGDAGLCGAAYLPLQVSAEQ